MSDRLRNGYKISHPEPGDEILITGLSGYFPESGSVAELQENLFNKIDLVTDDDRRWRTFDTEIPRAVGKISKLDKFDASFFGDDYKLAHYVDPMFRLLLERTYEAIIDAGMNPSEFKNKKTGVFAGCCFYESEKKLRYEKLNSNENGVIGSCHSNLACRVAQWLGVTGPAYTIDSACSSSIYALEHAFKAIRNGVCDAAIVCGSNLCLHPYVSGGFFRIGILSPEGRCKSFDKTANGYARSEAVVACLVQKAKHSRRAYTQIVYAKMNCDGFTDNGITYPAGAMQTRLLREVYEECDIPISAVEYCEAHGTGTAAGDLEELNALDNAMSTGRTEPLLIGTVKSNIGHSEGAAGLCAAAKMCIAYHSGYIPPNINFCEPQEGSTAISEGRFKVVVEKQAWNRGLACFSGFGFGGSNAHVLLKNFAKNKVNNSMPNDNLPRLVCISGRTKSAVDFIMDYLEAKHVDIEEIRLLHAIHENSIDGHKFRGFVLLKSIPTGSCRLARSVSNFREIRRPICLLYCGVGLQLAIVKKLMDIPVFAAAIQRCNTALKIKNVNLIDIISKYPTKVTGNNLKLYEYISTTALNIGLTDIIKNVDLKIDYFIGHGLGELSSAYADGSLTTEEAILIAHRQGTIYQETAVVNGNKDNGNKVNENKVNGNKVNGNKNENNAHEHMTLRIPSDAIGIQVTPGNSFKKTLKGLTEKGFQITLIEEDTETAQQDLFTGLGRLYEAGLNMKIANLYPSVPFPVSQNTPMLSHLAEWDHREKWYQDSFLKDIKKLETIERAVTISLNDPNEEFLYGHLIGGRRLYPGSGYLVLVWETLAMRYGCEYKALSVVFENIKFLRATNLPKKGQLLFNITIHPISGEFEVTENMTPVVTGFIYAKQHVGKIFDKLPSPDDFKDCHEIKLSQNDFYKEIRLRGYEHSGLFRGVIESSIEGSHSRITWTNNWVVFIDYILQVFILMADTRNLYVPTACNRISIDTDLHYEILANTKFSPDQAYIDVFIDNDARITRCGGVEIRGFNVSMVSKKADLRTPIFENYEFIPSYVKDTMKLTDIIRCNVDIINENLQLHKLKVIELNDDDNETNKGRCIIEEVEKILEDLPQVWAELYIVTNEKNTPNSDISTESAHNIAKLTILPKDKSAVLITGINLLKKKQVLIECESCLREGGFIMSQEEDLKDIKELEENYTIITVCDTGAGIIVLFRKKIEVMKKVFININTLDESFSWIEIVKENMEQRNKLVLYTHDEISGILGLVNCLRREPGGDIIQCFFIIDHDIPLFDPKLQLYKDQLDKDLAFNVFKDGQWGSYRHILCSSLDVMEPVPHACLNIETIGDLSSLKWHEGNVREEILEKDENVSFVHVYYSALNFRDVMLATGRVSVDSLISGRQAQTQALGSEFAGKLSNGMRVAGMAKQSMASVLQCNNNLMMTIPDEWTMKEASSVMVAYSTVYLAFDILGKMKFGESVLIHAGSGAVGQAAINVALHRGCEVFTTVGTQEKIDIIKKLYPELKDNHIGNSRDTSFEHMIMKETKGKGVDIVLNSLSEEKLVASIRCLGRRGRFLEIGKYDIFNNTGFEMYHHKKEISFHSVMLDYIIERACDGKMLIDLLIRGIVTGEVRPIPHIAFEKEDTEAAFRYMASGKHIGKVIIKMREDDDDIGKPEAALANAYKRYTCHRDYVYVIVGGLGGFGLELTDWLVLRGARKLVLVSSKGISTGYQVRRIRTLTSYGADIRILTDDVTTEAGCANILELALTMGHVEAIFNLAAILSDALFQRQSPETFKIPFGPKALATMYLDKVSRRMCLNLRDFVVFSSLACGRGNSGQSNYGLANSIMERICEKRRKDGLPGLAIQWGAIGDVGIVADLQLNTGDTDIGGLIPQRIGSCLQTLDKFLIRKSTVVSSFLLAHKNIRESVTKTAVETVAQIIGVKNLKNISFQTSLAELGMDSIMALEIKQTLERDFDIVLTAQDLKTLTFAKLRNLTTEQEESLSTFGKAKAEIDDNWEFDFRYFIRNFGEEENALKPYIIMNAEYNLDKTENTLALPSETLFMVPGFEGCAANLEPLCRQLHTTACVLQLPFDNQTFDLENMTDKLHKVINTMRRPGTPFNLLGYSYGTMPLLSLAAKLESEGAVGTVFCIDGAPTWLQTLFKKLGYTDDIKMQDYIVKYIFKTILPSDSVLAKLLQETSRLTDYDEKINYVTKHSPTKLKYSNEFIKKIGLECSNRLNILKDFNINFTTKIKSTIVLLRAENDSIDNFSKNYELDKFTDSDVKVHLLKGNHISILEDPNCALLIKSYMDNK